MWSTRFSISGARSHPSGSRIISSSSMPTVNGGPVNLWSSMGGLSYPEPGRSGTGSVDGRSLYSGRAYAIEICAHERAEKELMEVTTATEQKSLLETLSPGKRTRLHRL